MFIMMVDPVSGQTDPHAVLDSVYIEAHEMHIFQGDNPDTPLEEPEENVWFMDRVAWRIPKDEDTVYGYVAPEAVRGGNIIQRNLYNSPVVGQVFGPGEYSAYSNPDNPPRVENVTSGMYTGFLSWTFPEGADRNYSLSVRRGVDINFTEFYNSTTNLSLFVTTNNSLSLADNVTSAVYSDLGYPLDLLLTSINMTWNGELNGGNVTFSVSADNGTNWSILTKGTKMEFPSEPGLMKWKVELERLVDPDGSLGPSPRIDDLSMSLLHLAALDKIYYQTEFEMDMDPDSGLQFYYPLPFDTQFTSMVVFVYLDPWVTIEADGLNLVLLDETLSVGKDTYIHMASGHEPNLTFDLAWGENPHDADDEVAGYMEPLVTGIMGAILIAVGGMLVFTRGGAGKPRDERSNILRKLEMLKAKKGRYLLEKDEGTMDPEEVERMVADVDEEIGGLEARLDDLQDTPSGTDDPETDDTTLMLGMINAGATAQFEQNSIDLGSSYNVELSLRLPRDLEFDETNMIGLTKQQDFQGIRYVWDVSKDLVATIQSTNKDLVEYLNNSAVADVIVNIKTVNVESLPPAMVVTMDLNITIIAKIYHLEVPDSVALPEGTRLDYVNADAVRLAYEQKLFDRDDLTDGFSGELEAALESFDASPFITFDEKSWEFDDNTKHMTDDDPVIVRIYADAQLGNGGGSGAAAALLADLRAIFQFDEGSPTLGSSAIGNSPVTGATGIPVPQAIPELVGIPGWRVNYFVVLPYGIEIEGVTNDEYTNGVFGQNNLADYGIESGTAKLLDDNYERQHFLLLQLDDTNSISGSQEKTNVNLVITPIFLVTIPIIQGFLGIIIFFIVLIVGYRRGTKKRRDAKKRRKLQRKLAGVGPREDDSWLDVEDEFE